MSITIVLTGAAPPRSGGVEDLARLAGAEPAALGPASWLFTVQAPPGTAFASRARALGLDANLLPDPPARKRLLLADMDSTLIGQECIDELADFVGAKAEVAAITEAAMRGDLDFEPALRARVALLRGLPVTVADELLATRLTLNPGAATLLATMRAQGAYTCLVSGGFTLFTGPVAARLGFHEHRANVLEVSDGRLTGEVRAPILGREAKRTALIELRGRLGLDPGDTLAVGDGANDLAMLAEAGLGVAYRAKPAVAAAAHARLDHADLTGLLALQGIRAEDHVVRPEGGPVGSAARGAA